MRAKDTKNKSCKNDFIILLGLLPVNIINLMRVFEDYDNRLNLKTIIIVASALLYILACIYTYVKWKKQKIDKLVNKYG
ncbi:hypothetical protein J1C67_10605 [Clostridium gasigenes]|uniref:hypothetical protein n=1 Tax=Clostridium gasigenes TaxID=94869 RepID=UPI0014382938|nr:hypothetical protein [Clostridium gasigenes]NKF07594.1 hypothetical protein [Clostridium gasigenes]QSW18023.1 hypothetical protein J1C67_10605 [Clostridium gasigenes]